MLKERKKIVLALVLILAFVFGVAYMVFQKQGNNITSTNTELKTNIEETDDDVSKNGGITNGDLKEDEINSSKQGEEDQLMKSDKDKDFILPVKCVRPYAVMIDNQGTRVLPQGGIYKAQIVYEIMVEGGITRLMPVFWGTLPELVGPVRSSRHYFLDYVLEHDAIYVHFGYSPQAMTDISKLKINNINGVANGGEVFWDLTKDRNNWQDSYTSNSNIANYVQKVKYRTDTQNEFPFNYNEESKNLLNGFEAKDIFIKYSQGYSCKFIYDEKEGNYKRFRDGIPHMERITNEQLTGKNIIIQYARNYTLKGDTEGRQEVETVKNDGNGLFITNGKAINIKWSKKSRSSQTEYLDGDGKKINLNPGLTWIEIVPIENKVNVK